MKESDIIIKPERLCNRNNYDYGSNAMCFRIYKLFLFSLTFSIPDLTIFHGDIRDQRKFTFVNWKDIFPKEYFKNVTKFSHSKSFIQSNYPLLLSLLSY